MESHGKQGRHNLQFNLKICLADSTSTIAGNPVASCLNDGPVFRLILQILFVTAGVIDFHSMREGIDTQQQQIRFWDSEPFAANAHWATTIYKYLQYSMFLDFRTLLCI